MSCAQHELALALHVEGELDTQEAKALERHLQSCAACRELLESLQGSQAALRKHTILAENPPALEGFHGAVMANLQEELPQGHGRWRRLALAASLLLVLGSLVLWRSFENSSHLPPTELPEVASNSTGPSTVTTPTEPSAPTEPNASTEPSLPLPAPLPQPEDQIADAGVLPPPTKLPSPLPQTLPASPPKLASNQATPTDVSAMERPVPAPTASPASIVEEPESVVVKLVSDDPDLVIYWLIDPSNNEETTS